FELSRNRFGFVEFESVFDGETRRSERPEVVEKDGHVNVAPPFARAGILLPRLESIFKIEEHLELAVLLFVCLGEIDRLSKTMQGIDRAFIDLRHLDRGSLLKFEYTDSGVDQLLQRTGTVIALHRPTARSEHG